MPFCRTARWESMVARHEREHQGSSSASWVWLESACGLVEAE